MDDEQKTEPCKPSKRRTLEEILSVSAARNRRFRANNLEKSREYSRKYYQKHKEEIKKRRNIKKELALTKNKTQ